MENQINRVNTRNDMLDVIPKGGVCVELGVFLGEYSTEILNRINPSKLYLVDIWSGQMTSGDKDGNNIRRIQNMDVVYKDLVKKYSNNNNVEVIKMSSYEFLLNQSNNYFDFVYIDANHSYSSVLKDCEISLDKLKDGGYLAGHDYIDNYEVKNAVDDFCKKYNQKIETLTLNDGCPSFLIKIKKH